MYQARKLLKVADPKCSLTCAVGCHTGPLNLHSKLPEGKLHHFLLHQPLAQASVRKKISENGPPRWRATFTKLFCHSITDCGNTTPALFSRVMLTHVWAKQKSLV